MIYAAVAGAGARVFCKELYLVLGKICEVVCVEDTALSATGDNPNILLWQSAGSAKFNVPGSVLIVSDGSAGLMGLRVDDDCVVVADSADEAAAAFAAARGLRLLDCGLSSKASLTFSSIGMGASVISLQRAIFDIYGNKVEPFDMPLDIEGVPYYPVLAAVGILLLSGKSDKIWI
ncbi:MAG: hypothetical protein RR049_04255 [Angelakisella sp.]